MHFLSRSLFFKKIQGNVFLPRKEVSQLKIKFSRLHPHMFLLVQPKHLRTQLPEAPGGKWSLATPSRAVHAVPLSHTLQAPSVPPLPWQVGVTKCLGKQIILVAGRSRIGLTQGFQPHMLQLQVYYAMFHCPEESTHLRNGAPGSVL